MKSFQDWCSERDPKWYDLQPLSQEDLIRPSKSIDLIWDETMTSTADCAGFSRPVGIGSYRKRRKKRKD